MMDLQRGQAVLDRLAAEDREREETYERIRAENRAAREQREQAEREDREALSRMRAENDDRRARRDAHPFTLLEMVAYDAAHASGKPKEGAA